MAVSNLFSLLAPKQLGTIYQGAGVWREVVYRESRDGRVFFALVQGKGEGTFNPGGPATYQTLGDNGIIRCRGVLNSMNLVNQAVLLEFTPDPKGPEHINRRQAFRVAVSMRAKIVGTTIHGEEKYDTEWECSLRDLSVGGARLSVASPPPARRSLAMINLKLQTETSPLILPCLVIESSPGVNNSQMDALVRVAFHAITSRVETQLNRYVNWVQLDMLRKGVR